MRTLFLTSSGLNEKTMVLFWKCIGKECMYGAPYEYGNTYECFILGKHTARNGVAGISPPRREFQKC